MDDAALRCSIQRRKFGINLLQMRCHAIKLHRFGQADNTAINNIFFGDAPQAALNGNRLAMHGIFDTALPAFFQLISNILKPCRQIFCRFIIIQRRAFQQSGYRRLLDHITMANLPRHLFDQTAGCHRIIGHIGQIRTCHLATTIDNQHRIFQTGCHQIDIKFALVFQIDFRLTTFRTEQRRLGNIQITLLDQRPHMPEEKRQQQCANMATVHIGIGHDDDLVIAHFIKLHFGIANACPNRRD